MIEITKQNFDSEVLSSDVPVILEFSANWCQPCKSLSGTLGKLEEELSGKAKFCVVDVDEDFDLTNRFVITTVPTMLFFDHGALKDKAIGIINGETIKKKLMI